jgi:hypothetical protein
LVFHYKKQGALDILVMWCRRVAEREAAVRMGNWRSGLGGVGGAGGVFESEAFSGEGDNPGMVKEPVENGGGGGHIADELTPILEGAVGGHEGGAVFVAAHDDLQQVLTGVLGQLLQSHIVDDEQVGLEVMAQETVLLVEGLVLEKIADQIEDRGVADKQVALDRFVADGLGQMGFAQSRRTEEEDVGAFLDEVASGQLEELLLGQLGIKAPVEVLEGFQSVELSRVTLFPENDAVFCRGVSGCNPGSVVRSVA